MAESFEQFAEKHYQAAYRFALSLCCHEADACDLTQQAFYIAQTKFHQVRDQSKQKSWLFTTLSVSSCAAAANKRRTLIIPWN